VIAAKPAIDDSVRELEIRLLLEALYHHSGFDFRDYAPASLRRRIENFMRGEHLSTVSALQERILHDPGFVDRFLPALSVHVSAMFRDPEFFLAFRAQVVPLLRTYPFVRIWLAGCSMGEEVYSVAILLREERLYDRSLIYATDMNEAELKRAKTGVYPLDLMRRYTHNYIRAGGAQAFSEYYSAGRDGAVIEPSLKERVVFSQHNLVTDGSFNEFNVILCRNVMIYFNRVLQDRVHQLIYQSLAVFGILGLGVKETLRFTPHADAYEELDAGQKLFRRIS
jgi:chemotaxis protein methyltransferase CheR